MSPCSLITGISYWGIMSIKASIGSPALVWQIVGVGDFDGDETDDILWRNTATGNTMMWRMVALAKDSQGFIGTPSTAWQVACVGDYDGAGADILWRNSGTGNTVIWQMNGFAKQATGSIGNASSVWEVRC